jgi:hypothetical protein
MVTFEFLASMRSKERRSFSAEQNNAIVTLIAIDQAVGTSILPDRQARASAPPRIENFSVGPRAVRYPLEQLQRQRLRWIGHGIPSWRLFDLHAVFACQSGT